MTRLRLILAMIIAPLVVSPGCGESTNHVWVTGKLLKGGASYAPPKDQQVYVTLVGLEIQDKSGNTIKSGEPFWAEVDQESGTFFVPGTDGQGIPPGKYRVAVTQKMEREAFNAKKPDPKKRAKLDREADLLANRFGVGTSPIIREVKTRGELVIDLDRPTE
jgi:hypothetical protein